MMDVQNKILDIIRAEVPGAGAELSEFHGDTTLTIKKESIVQVARVLKTNPELQFVLCEDVTAIDWAKRKDRFTIVYHLFSLHLSFRLRVSVLLPGVGEEIDSVAAVWQSADWYERETFDMYGITFTGHPDPRRMYMPEEFEYHPLRKEFPVLGIPGSLPLPKK